MIAGLICFSLGMTGVFLANILVTAMIGEINRRRGDENLISYFGFTPPKTALIFQEYRRLYPSGRLHQYAIGAFALCVIGFFGALLCIRIALR
jgi:hypothetical protein